MIRSVVRAVIRDARRYLVGLGGSQTIPRTGLLLFLPQENEYRDLGWDEEVDWDESLTGYFSGDVASIRTATGWTAGNANPLYAADGTPLVASRAEIEGWARVNTANILFKYPKLAIYDSTVNVNVLFRAKAVLKIT